MEGCWLWERSGRENRRVRDLGCERGKKGTFMFRKSALAMAMLGTLTTGNVVALGLGEIQLGSALNQPLQAEVELLSATPAELNELKVDIGSSQAFENAGLERPLFLTKLKFDVSKNAEGKPVVRITSRDVVREPFLDFLLEVSWSKGRLLREYTVLVDPPVTMPAPAPVPRAPVAQASGGVSQPVASSSRVTHTAIMPPVSVSPSQYQTRRNDTLWQVAQEVRPDSGVSMEQTMLALLRANPEAFYDDNINNLKAGYILRVPDRAGMTSVSKAEALRESRAQYAAWREDRAVTAGQPAGSTDVPVTSVDSETGREAHLQLVAPDLSETGSAGGSAEKGNQLDLIQRDLMMANEALEAERRRGDELSGRMAVLEEQIRNMQRLIQLKDDELAQLQAQAAGDAVTETQTDMTESGVDTMATAAQEDGIAVAEAEAGGEVVADAGEMFVDAAPVEADSAGGAPLAADTGDAATTPDGLSAIPMEADAVEETMPAFEPEASAESAPVVPATATTPGFVDQLLANPLWLGAGGLVLVLLAFFGLRRKRGVETGFQESILQASQGRSLTADSEITDSGRDRSGDSNETSLLSEFAVSDMGSLRHGGEADPLAEADVYLAYGRFQQAEDLIRDALENNSEDESLNLKLLEVHLASKNPSAFDAHAQGILARLENSSDPMWERVAEMGRELSPENPLYQSGVAESANTEDLEDIDLFKEEVSFDVAEPGDGLEGQTAEMPVSDEDNRGLDFDIGLPMEGEGARNEDQPDSVEFTAPEVTSGLEFDMDSVEPDAIEQESALDFDLEDFDLGNEEEAAAGDGELTDLDEVSTKLDLARAYIDMGDPDGARNILDEVMEEGSDDQKSEARGIMEQIS